MSTSGSSLRDTQASLIGKILAKYCGEKNRAELVLAMDKDAAGDKMAQDITELAPAGARIVRDVPASCKDWNDELQARAALQAGRKGAQERVFQADREEGAGMGLAG